MSESEKFLTEEVPAAFADTYAAFKQAAEDASGDEADDMEDRLDEFDDLEVTVKVSLTGAGGRDYYFNLSDSELEVSDEGAFDSLVEIVQDVTEFETLKRQGVDALSSAGGKPSSGRIVKSLMKLNPDIVDRISQQNVTMKLVLTEVPEIDTASVVIRLGTSNSHPDPLMTISATVDNYRQIASGKVPAPQAFMQGLLKIDGDISIAMRLASLAV
ncbi:MAG: SCP2 sterol-binding domain-containing protein [Myxococcales bacterium]|nr:SCP2 sterol-binding domain-containing protein [Myxococcales bacterium]